MRVSVCVCVVAYQADVVVQQWQGEEVFQSDLVEAGFRQTCRTHTHTHTHAVEAMNVSGEGETSLQPPQQRHGCRQEEAEGDLELDGQRQFSSIKRVQICRADTSTSFAGSKNKEVAATKRSHLLHFLAANSQNSHFWLLNSQYRRISQKAANTRENFPSGGLSASGGWTDGGAAGVPRLLLHCNFFVQIRS